MRVLKSVTWVQVSFCTLPSWTRSQVVCDDASERDIRSIVEAFRGRLEVSYLRQESRRGPATCRNMGWRYARGEVIVFLDDDEMASPHYLEAIATAMTEAGPDVAGVEGPILPDEPFDERDPFIRAFRVEAPGHGLTGNVALRRSILEAVGGFDESFDYQEDYDISWRIRKGGGRFGFAPQAVVYHPVLRWSLREWSRAVQIRWPSIIRLFIKHPDQFPPQFLPAWLLRPLRKTVLRRPSFPALFVFMVLNRLAWWAYYRRLWLRRPILGLKGTALLIADLGTLLWDLPRLAAHYRQCRREFQGAPQEVAT